MAPTPPIRLAHVITGLEVGGAELLLLRLAKALDPTAFCSVVISMTEHGPVGRQLQALGIETHALGMQRVVPDPRGLVRLVRLLGRTEAKLVHSWLYHADLLAGAAARLSGSVPLVWSVHMTSLDRREAKLKTRLAARACALLAPTVPRCIICSSVSAARAHEELGYPARRMTVIPNGVDTELFRPDEGARAQVREELGLPPEMPLIGMAARFSPQKDHRTLLGAAAALARDRPDVQFLLCGDGVDKENQTLTGWIGEHALADRVHLLGVRQDMPRIQAALDIATLSSSWGETAPLAISEAMSSGVICVTTDVGDLPRMVADSGIVVPPGEPRALAAAWQQVLDASTEECQARGAAARRRAVRDYSLTEMVSRYAATYGRLLDPC